MPRRRDHGGGCPGFFKTTSESSLESYATEREALLAGFERMEQLERQAASIGGRRAIVDVSMAAGNEVLRGARTDTRR